MFGLNQKDLMEKMKKSLDESKERMSNIKVSGESGSGLVRIELDGNRKFSSLCIFLVSYLVMLILLFLVTDRHNQYILTLLYVF